MKKKILITSIIGILAIASYLFFSSSMEKPIARTVKSATLSNIIPEGMDSTYISELSKIGFSQLEEVKLLKYTKERQRWSLSGFLFIGDEEMTKFLKDNDFIIGDANRFLEPIPIDAGKKMIHRFGLLKDSLTMYYLTVYNPFEMTYILNAEDMAIRPETSIRRKEEESFIKYIKPEVIVECKIPPPYVWDLNVVKPAVSIIAGAKMFNTEGMVIEDGILKASPPKDPIAVVKVLNGWVEIASW